MDLMDWQTSALVVGVFFALAIIVYLISVFGTLEKSYEEAVEEQRRLSQEIATQNKSDKPKKEKKFKKWGKRTKEKGRDGEKVPLTDASAEANNEQEVRPERVEFKPEAEIILTDSEPDHRPPKAKKKGKIVPPKSILVNNGGKGDLQPPSESEESPGESRSRGNSFDKVHPKDEIELSKYKIEKLERQASLSQEADGAAATKAAADASSASEEVKKEESIPTKSADSKKKQQPSEVKSEIPQQVKEEVTAASVQAPVSASPRKKNKKTKLEPFDGADGLDISGKKLIEILKNAALNDEEIQLLINVLLNKQQDGSWTKKNDPVATLKKQLQEKELALETEQQNTQTATAKVRELHQELGQEKSRTSALEKKLSLLQQELQALHARMQHAHEQHVAETQTLQAKLQQVQNKRNEDHASALKRLQEDNNRLQQALSQLEAENQSRNSIEVSRLQHEIEQLLASRDQYETRQAAMQQTADDLRLQIQQLVTSHQEETQRLISSHQEKEYGYKQRLADLTSKLQQMEGSGASLMDELLSLKAMRASLEEEKTLLCKQLDEVKQVGESREKEQMHLRKSLEEIQKRSTDAEARAGQLQARVSELAEKETEQAQHIQHLCHEKENLMLQVQELTAKAAEIPTKQQNGDISSQEAHENMVKRDEHEKLLSDKELALTELRGELDKCNTEIKSLREEIKSQQNKNNELREKNWKAMEALEAAQKNAEAAEKKHQQSEQLVHDMESKLKDAESKQQLSQACEQKVKEAETEIERLRASHEEACKEKSRVEDQYRQRIEDLQNLVNTVQGKEKELSLCLEKDHKEVQDVMQRIFPSVKVPSCKEYDQWVLSFEKEALKVLKTLQLSSNTDSSNSAELKNLSSQLSEAKEVITKLEAQVHHYKIALSDTENMLTKLQCSVEAEEQSWRQKMETKEQELIKAIKVQEALRKEKSKLEASLEQLQGVEEMQSKLIELQAKLQGEENEKKSLEVKFDEANKSAISLQEQLENRIKELEDMKKDKLDMQDIKQELENVRSHLEKEKKITKDLSSQVVKLDALLKIGQDSFKAEEAKVLELQAQLQAVKDSTPNGPPHAANMNSTTPAQIDGASGKK